MRCWECKHLIIVPEMVPGPSPAPQAISHNPVCPHCGAWYKVEVSRMPGYMKVAKPPAADNVDPKEEDHGLWKR